MYSYEARTRAVELYIKLGSALRRPFVSWAIRQRIPSRAGIENTSDATLPVGYARSKPKHSDEQKNVAVEHCVTHDCCIAATLKALGYPGRATLAAWVDELHPEIRKRVVGRASGVPPPAGLKKAAVIELCIRKGSAKAVAQKLGVSRPTLYNWKNRLLGREVPAAMKRPNDSPPEPHSAFPA